MSDSVIGEPLTAITDINGCLALNQSTVVVDLITGVTAEAMYMPGYEINEPQEFVNSGFKWLQPRGLGTPVTITYSYSNLLDGNLPGGIVPSMLKAAIEEALKLWASYAPLNFREVADSGPAPSDAGYDSGSHPQLRFGHHFIDGSSSVLAHAYYPGNYGLAGDVHFDNGDTWKTSPSGGIDILEVAVHEIGHALGLAHEESGINAIMNPFYGSRYSGLGTAFLLQDDINGIRNIYGTGVGSVTRIGFNSQLLTDYTIMKGDLTNLIVGDYNGDGRDDFIRQEKGAYAVDDILTAQIYLSNGNGTFSSQLLTDYTIMKGDLTNLIVGDYNGDGRDDFIRQEKGAYAVDDILTAQIYLSNGNGTFTNQDLNDSYRMKGDLTNLILGNFNGDGKDDFIRQEKGIWDDDDIVTAEVYISSIV
ncbi:MAG TPA: matrixin family metalloprotease [Coleofasciculaceae cyanobacterium]